MVERKTRDKSKKRAAILDGAIDVFISLGYDLASMDKVAETAGVSKRTVYNHFGSKETLFHAIVDDFLSQRQALKEIKYNPCRPLREQLMAFAEAEIFLIDSPRRLGLSRCLTRVFLRDIDYARATVAMYPPSYGMLLEWLKAAEKDGRIRSDNLLLTARMFYSMVEGAITWPAIFSHGIDKTVTSPLLDEIVQMFLARYGHEKAN
jgi:TetR/AcrR family transcriptional regulator, regulator of autoinduction and epiphytic fitness